MKCPFCGSEETKVMDKRETEGNSVTRRRRECLKCEKRFTTYERLEAPSLAVVKKDGTREQFDRDKLTKGLIRACEKTPVSREKIDETVTEIEAELRNMDDAEILSKKIGMIVMKKLKKLDKVAYIRFASVYNEFKDLEDFNKEVEKLTRK
jgi:transcriptional repressor NrdR